MCRQSRATSRCAAGIGRCRLSVFTQWFHKRDHLWLRGLLVYTSVNVKLNTFHVGFFFARAFETRTEKKNTSWMSLLYNLLFWFLSSWLTVSKCSNNWLLSKFNSSCLVRGFVDGELLRLLVLLMLFGSPCLWERTVQRSFDWSVCLFELCWHLCVCVCVYVCAHESQSGVGLTERSAGWLEHAGSFPQSRQHSVPNEFSSGRAFALGHNHKAYCYRHKRGARGMGPVNGDRRDPSGMRIRDREAKRKWSIIF